MLSADMVTCCKRITTKGTNYKKSCNIFFCSHFLVICSIQQSF